MSKKSTDVVNITLFPFGTLSILTIIFVIAKIMGYINWSWFLVLLPITWWLWIVAGVLAVVVVVAAICGVLALICFCGAWVSDKLFKTHFLGW